jgi:hypothetical protein
LNEMRQFTTKVIKEMIFAKISWNWNEEHKERPPRDWTWSVHLPKSGNLSNLDLQRGSGESIRRSGTNIASWKCLLFLW